VKLSCFFPMYNEAANIKAVVASAVSVLAKSSQEFEVIIVNDGSSDRTQVIAEELAKNDPRIKVVNHAANQGYGAALRSGFAACQHEIIFQCDGDNQYQLAELKLLLPYLNDYDFVIGYRLKRADPFYRVLEALWYRFLLLVLFRLNLRDTNCAFKLFKKSILEQLKLESNGAIINGEVFVKARKFGFTNIKQVGVHHYPRPKGAQTGAKPRVLLEALASILRLWWQGRSCQ